MEIEQISNFTNGQSAPVSFKPKRLAMFRGFEIGCLLSLLIFINSNFLQDKIYFFISIFSGSPVSNQSEATQKEYKHLDRNVKELHRRLEAMTPRSRYVIINTSENLYTLKSGRKVLHEGICSTGSYTMLKTYDDKEQWIFKTPRGIFRVNDVLRKPVWRMPDWAFVEEGLPIPSAYSPKRYEYGVLGDWALDIGRGYLIHGTLYQRFLGLPVTHGCIRLGDDDLKVVIHNLSVGSKVYIY
jgi:lipoprotein-anchoring transpeptidase ErfK/SrfK